MEGVIMTGVEFVDWVASGVPHTTRYGRDLIMRLTGDKFVLTHIKIQGSTRERFSWMHMKDGTVQNHRTQYLLNGRLL